MPDTIDHRHIFIRPVSPDDTKKFIDWSLENPNNGFDPEVAKYPSTFVLCAYDKNGPLAYMPVQRVFMMDAVATRPGASELRVAASLKEFTQALVTEANIKGVGEIYFLATDDGTNKMAENQLFEKLPYAVYRCKVKELEG
jgi:hypothetical protein